MTNPVIIKLRHGAELTAVDEATLSAALGMPTELPPHTRLMREGDPPNGLVVVLKGVVCRYKNLNGGERQIVAVLVPGDTCDVHASLLHTTDHGLSTIGPCTVAKVPWSVVRGWLAESATIRQAFAWSALLDEAILREWLVNLCARKAPERMAHLFCELLARLRTVSSASANEFLLAHEPGAVGSDARPVRGPREQDAGLPSRGRACGDEAGESRRSRRQQAGGLRRLHARLPSSSAAARGNKYSWIRLAT